MDELIISDLMFMSPNSRANIILSSPTTSTSYQGEYLPDKTKVDTENVITYAAGRNEIAKNVIELEPFECKKTLIRSLFWRATDQGFFVCFHSVDGFDEIQRADII